MAVLGQKRGRYKIHERRRVELRLIADLVEEIDELANERGHNNRSAVIHILLEEGLKRIKSGKLDLERKLRKMM